MGLVLELAVRYRDCQNILQFDYRRVTALNKNAPLYRDRNGDLILTVGPLKKGVLFIRGLRCPVV